MSDLWERKIYHGSSEVTEGKLKGSTDRSDYFYFLCPKCPGKEMLRILDYKEMPIAPKPTNGNEEEEVGFTLAFKFRCEKCGFQDFVKISNLGWQGGQLPSLK